MDQSSASGAPDPIAPAAGAALARSDTFYGRLERLAFAAAGLIMLAIVGTSSWMAAENERSVNDAAQAQGVRSITIELLEAVISAESGQRGYLLTGKDRYLAPYDNAAQRVPWLLAELDRRLPSNNRAVEWRGIITRKMDELARTVALARAGKRDEALAIVDSDVGQRLMDQAREIADEMAEQQRHALENYLRISRYGASALVAVDTTAFVLLALLAVFLVNSANRYVDRLRKARRAVEDANAQLQAGRDMLETTVAERTAELRAVNEEIQNFAYIVSHDLRAPLLNIIGFTNELESATGRLNQFVETHIAASDVPIPEDVRTASEEDLPEAIRFIQTSTAKMDRLINAILRLSREGRREMVPERLNMAAVLGNVIDSLRHQADEGGIEVTLGAVPDIISDRLAVEQVFSNLIENALKYTLDGRAGRVEIGGKRERGFVTFTVADNGRGIAPRDLQRIFDLFRRAGNQDRPGEGIGLAHVKALVRRLGGAIECRSIFGEGSTFVVRLPAVLAHGGSEKT
jgi:signal transduction histidine kinase